jgi:hypothetical protein
MYIQTSKQLMKVGVYFLGTFNHGLTFSCPLSCILMGVFWRFLDLLKINFVIKSSKTEIFKKPHINLFFA